MSTRLQPRVWITLALLFCASMRTQAALVDVTMTVTPTGGVYDYAVSVTNHGPLDVTLVSILDAPPGDTLIPLGLIGPAGFLTFFDPGAGIINFLEDTSLFAAGTTVSGFEFYSAVSPPTFLSTFEAIDVAGVVTTGDITITVVPPGVPEAGSSLLLALLGCASAVAFRWIGRPARTPDPSAPTL